MFSMTIFPPNNNMIVTNQPGTLDIPRACVYWVINLDIRPIHLRAASEFVKQFHRHNIPPVGGKFAVACYDENRLCGVAICGRPVSRHLDDGKTLEIYRNCTDGTYNVCSKLYGACVRIAREMGYSKVITYTLQSENGASLKASNFVFDGSAGGTSWTGKRKRNYFVAPQEMKNRWIFNIR